MCVLWVNQPIHTATSNGVRRHQMLSSAEDRREAIRPQFNRKILVDFRGQPHTRRGLSAARHWSATRCRAELSWGKNDLGIHSEMISDGAMNLVEAGVI